VVKTQGAFHIPSLDGVRAVAVLVVFVGHGYVAPEAWPGHVGVSIFFFLSGYLITTLLRREYDRTGRIRLGRFYQRRLLRITPPALIAISVCVVVGLAGLLPSTTTGWGVLAEVFNYTNYYLVATGGRGGLPPESSMLWSLAVEEHFYLVFPALLIVFLWRRLSYRQIGYILLAAAAAAPVWRLVLHFVFDASFFRLYVSTDTRFDGLLVGAAMALLWNPVFGDRTPLRLSEGMLTKTVAPLALIIFAGSALASENWRLTVVDSVQYACLIPIFWFIVTRPDSIIGRVLNSRVVSHIGALSFSIYLVHKVALALVAKSFDSAPLIDVGALVVSILAAQVIYELVEQPLGKVRRRLEGSRQPSAAVDTAL